MLFMFHLWYRRCGERQWLSGCLCVDARVCGVVCVVCALRCVCDQVTVKTCNRVRARNLCEIDCNYTHGHCASDDEVHARPRVGRRHERRQNLRIGKVIHL